MFSFKFNEKEYELPTEWSEITVDDYIKLYNLEQNKDLYPFDELYAAKMLQLLLNMEESDIDSMPISLFTEILEKMSGLNVDNLKFETKKIIEFDGKTYIFRNLNDLSFGEYASIKVLTKDKSYTDILLTILSVLIREEGVEFDGKNIEGMKDIVKRMSFIHVGELVGFFFDGKK